MNIKSQTPTIRSYGTPSIYSGANLWIVNEEEKWVYIDHNGSEHVTDLSAASGSPYAAINSPNLFKGKGSFQKNLDLLNQRINIIHKELSYWDLYRITDSVLTEESFPAVISGLAVGNSAVINCDTFTYNNQRYHRGDVIVKINDSEELWIKSINAGSFMPVGFSENQGLYTLEFEYHEGEGVATTVSGLEIASEGNSIYGYSYEKDSLGTEHFPIEYIGTGTNATPIKPVVKSFVLSDNGYEEIVLDGDLIVSSSSTDWVLGLAGKPNDIKIYIQVK